MNDPKFANNPWSAEHWNLTHQGQYVRQYGVEVAKTKAKEAGTTLSGKPPQVAAFGPFSPMPKRNFTVIVQNKGGGGGSNVSNLIGAGSSGDGPPG